MRNEPESVTQSIQYEGIMNFLRHGERIVNGKRVPDYVVAGTNASMRECLEKSRREKGPLLDQLIAFLDDVHFTLRTRT